MPGGPAAQDGIRVDDEGEGDDECECEGEEEEDGAGEKALGVFGGTDDVRDMRPPPAV
ncbi:hypothetical protein SAMN04487980_1026100 [Streptomyces sp. cf124]|uniref:hypothetical protein n=1 Tax=Streptomyces TaxID=1883 RepID=UPI0008EE0452|nr:hypothetical protein [Streptomyces sp. cf124]SFN63061.1 hypothetical protein SAMN04487980_1026100 [Streptomyces sp. cf124]